MRALPLIDASLLERSDKILFIAHLAIGDFTYLQNDLKAFSERYPHLKLDLWIDELRRTSDATQWEFLKNYSLYDWTEHCAFLRKVYRRTYSPELLSASIHEAQEEHYPIVVSLATLRPHQYAKLARQIGPQAFVVGMREKHAWYAWARNSAYAKLDATIAPFARPTKAHHISEEYANWFEQVCGLNLAPEQRYPFVNIPQSWQTWAQDQFAHWQIGTSSQHRRPVIFINSFAKIHKRCWPMAKVVQLIQAMRALPNWQHSVFIINSVPQELARSEAILREHHLADTHLFSATENFFQLPAVLQRCDLVISVETAVMHLANAVHVPVIALMRQKNPEWAPIDRQHSQLIITQRRRDHVSAISVQEVLDAVKSDAR